jgi:glycosyltransferase involved in cell wall biosynthesis
LKGYRLTGALRLAEEGYYRGFTRVLDLALRTRAELFVAHTQGALPIAARAAKRLNARFGFDCEDLLAEEAADGLAHPAFRQAILDIERAYLPRASYVTATSRAMAAHLARAYGIRPHVVLNVFPLADLHGIARPAARTRGPRTELVWLSATVGAGRGIEDAVRALALLPQTARLTIVGRMLPSYEPELTALIAGLGLADRVRIEPPVPEPGLVLSTMSRFDIGLALDSNACLNRSLTICNKLFFSLQTGLLVAATDTPGQREVIDRVPRAGFVYPPGDAAALAARLEPFVIDRAKLLAAQEAAWEAGQRRFNWDQEQGGFLEAVGGPSSVSSSALAGAAESGRTSGGNDDWRRSGARSA